MIIYRSLTEIERVENTVVTIGTFDGLHLGHQTILERLDSEKIRQQGRSLVITFYPHPQQILKKSGDSVPILTPIERKLELLLDHGVDAVAVIPFDQQFASTPWQKFIEILIAQVGLCHMVVGHDHAFGKNREGNVDSLKEFSVLKGFEVTEVLPRLADDIVVSSSKIRKAIVAGELELASKWLGRNFSVDGRVERGHGRGSELGFATANVVPLEPNQLIPMNGVYAVLAKATTETNRPFDLRAGMANIGLRPTFVENQTKSSLEVHLFDWFDELYNEVLRVEFVKLIRLEQKFPSKDAFVDQLSKDRRESEAILNRLLS